MHLRLHSSWTSSSAWRVRIGLSLKGLPYEYRAVDLAAGDQDRAGHRALSPFGHVPVLEVEAEDGGGDRAAVLVESMAILHYLEERFPDRPLLPPDAAGRARVRALAEHVNSAIQPLQNGVVKRWLDAHQPGAGEPGAGAPGLGVEFARHFNRIGLAALEAALKDGGAGRFCHGDAPGLADCYLVPQLFAARRLQVDLAPYPTLLAIEAACEALPAFQAAHYSRQPDAPPGARLP